MNLAKILDDSGYKTRYISEKSGIGMYRLYYLRRGYGKITVDEVRKIASVLNISTEDFLLTLNQ